jgi:hypothetical protein
MPYETSPKGVLLSLKSISALDGTLRSLGVTPKTPCDPKSIIDRLTEMAKKLGNDIVDGINAIISKSGVDSIMGVVVILAALVGGGVSALIETILGDIIFGNLAGGALALVASFFTLVPGIEIIFQYLLVKTLKTQIEYRIKLITLIEADIESIISLLQTFINLFANSKKEDATYADIENAYKEINSALLTLGIEISRLSYFEQEFSNVQTSQLKQANSKGAVNYNQPNVLQVNNVLKAEDHINAAVDLLTGKVSSKLKGKLKGYGDKYTSKANPISKDTPFSEGYVDYFKSLGQGLQEEFFIIKGTPGTPEWRKNRDEKIALYKSFLQMVMPELPQMLQLLLVTESFTQPAGRLMAKFPLGPMGLISEFSMTDASSGIKNLNDFYKKKLSPPDWFIQILIGQSKPTNNNNVDPFFTADETKDLTLSDINSNVKLQEILILSFPSLWKNVRVIGNFYINNLKASVSQLNTVKTSINDTIHVNKENLPSKWQLIVKKLQWVSQLEVADSYLKPMTSEGASYGFNGVKVSALEVADLIDSAGRAIDCLKYFITVKCIDDEGNPMTEPITLAIDKAQSILLPLLSNVAILVSPSGTKNLIAQMQSIKFLLNKQLTLDNAELNYCNNVITTIEDHAAFTKLKQIFDMMIGFVSKLPTGDLVHQLDKGNVAGLVSAATSVSNAATDLIDMVKCNGSGVRSPSLMDQLTKYIKFTGIEVPGGDELKRIKSEVDIGLQDLKRKKANVAMITENGLKFLEAKKETAEATGVGLHGTQPKITPDMKDLVTGLDKYNMIMGQIIKGIGGGY